VWRSSLLDLCPRIWAERGQLYARSSWLQQALTLFAFSRFVHVDARLRVVFVDRRFLWFLHSRRSVRFDRIRHIDYRFSRIVTEWSSFVGATDQWEKFVVALALRDPDEKLVLFRFRGFGSVGTGFYGVLFGDDIIDSEGLQQTTSLAFIEALQRLLGVGIGEMPVALETLRKHGWECSACKQLGPPRPGKCLYCGSPRAERA